MDTLSTPVWTPCPRGHPVHPRVDTLSTRSDQAKQLNTDPVDTLSTRAAGGTPPGTHQQ